MSGEPLNEFVKVSHSEAARPADSQGFGSPVGPRDQAADTSQPDNDSAPSSSSPSSTQVQQARRLLRNVSMNLQQGQDSVRAFLLPEGLHEAPEGSEAGDSSDLESVSEAAEGQPPAVRKPIIKRITGRFDISKWSPEQRLQLDKVAFFAGVINLVLSAYWLGHSPHTWYRWFTLKACVLFTVRYEVYRAKNFQMYLLEYCYFANVLLLLDIWVLYRSPFLFKVVFSQAAGPLTWSIPALGNSLVLHSLDKTTSLFMHVSPAIMAWVLRWYPTPGMQQQRDAEPAWGKGGFVDLVLWPVFFYFLWAVLYYVQVFINSSDKVLSRRYSTLYTLMLDKRSGLPAKIVLRAPKQLQPLAYMAMHMALCSVATLTSLLWWHSYWAHTLFVIACASSSAWMGANYTFEVFLHRHLASLGITPKANSKAKKAT